MQSRERDLNVTLHLDRNGLLAGGGGVPWYRYRSLSGPLTGESDRAWDDIDTDDEGREHHLR